MKSHFLQRYLFALLILTMIPFQGVFAEGSVDVLNAITPGGTTATKTGSVRTKVNGACVNVPAYPNQCKDGFDNQVCDGNDYGHGKDNGDHKADDRGVDTSKPEDGIIDVEPDPSCFSPSATVEKGDDVVSKIIPCTDKCTFTDVFRLLNNFLTFFITILLIPIFIIIIMYAGYKYLMAGASGGAKADVKKMIGNIVKGMVLILCAWLIVRTIMTTLLNDDFKATGIEFLGN